MPNCSKAELLTENSPGWTRLKSQILEVQSISKRFASQYQDSSARQCHDSNVPRSHDSNARQSQDSSVNRFPCKSANRSPDSNASRFPDSSAGGQVLKHFQRLLAVCFQRGRPHPRVPASTSESVSERPCTAVHFSSTPTMRPGATPGPKTAVQLRPKAAVQVGLVCDPNCDLQALHLSNSLISQLCAATAVQRGE